MTYENLYSTSCHSRWLVMINVTTYKLLVPKFLIAASYTKKYIARLYSIIA